MSEPRSEKTVSQHSGVGTTLRARREQLGWQIDDIADHLKMRPSTIRALEDDDYESLPGKAYALGFVRSYATFLELDSVALVASLNQSLLSRADKTEMPSVSMPPAHVDRGVSITVLVIVGIVIVVIAYACWYRFGGHTAVSHSDVSAVVSEQKMASSPSREKPEEENSPVGRPSSSPQPAASTVPTLPDARSEGMHDNAQADQTPDVTPEPEPQHEERDDHGVVTLPPPSQSGSEQEGAAKPSPFELPKQDSHNDEASSHSESPHATLDPHIIVVRVAQDSWVQIKNAQGRVVSSRIMKKGESWQGDDHGAPYRITAGNAGGVYVQAGDVTSEPLGAFGTVKRNISISSHDVEEGRFGHGTLPEGMPAMPEDTQKDRTNATPELDHRAPSH